MALSDSFDLANNTLFQNRVYGALVTYANTVGAEASKPAGTPASWTIKRFNLLAQVIMSPTAYAGMFARAAAGNPGIMTTYTGASGTIDQKQAAVTDTTINNYVQAAWDVIAGVIPADKGT